MSGKPSIAPHEAFGQVLRQMRQAAGLTQEQLSLESGVQRNFISLIELGQNQPTITTVFKLAQALGCLPSVMVAYAEEMSIPQREQYSR